MGINKNLICSLNARDRIIYPTAICTIFNGVSEVSNQNFDKLNRFKNNKRHVKPTHTYSLKSLNSEFIKIGKAREAG